MGVQGSAIDGYFGEIGNLLRSLVKVSCQNTACQQTDISEPKTAKTIGQGIMQGPDDRGLGEESSSSRWSRPGDTSGLTGMISLCATVQQENGAALVACATVSAAFPGWRRQPGYVILA